MDRKSLIFWSVVYGSVVLLLIKGDKIAQIVGGLLQ